jgi:hypothetical protein
MSTDNLKIEKKKIAVTEQTYEKLKQFSRYNGLKLRLTIDSMIDIILQDEELSKRIVQLTLDKETKSSE